MTHSLPVFTPSLQPPQLLEERFVAREPLLVDIVERVRAAAVSGTRNHTLLVGPRGAGKTHLLALVYHRVKALADEGTLAASLAWLPEDPWAVASYDGLLRQIIQHLEPPVAVAEDPAARAGAEDLEALMTAAVRLRGPIVCFVENLDQVLDLIGTLGQQRLRHLAQERTLLLVATTTQLSRDLADQARPFYGFFTTTRLRALTTDEAAAMLAKIARSRGDERTANYLATPQAHARLRVVEHLAGGQPRIWALLARALTVADLDEVVKLLLTRFDDLTPYYQEQLARLSPQQRLVVVTLAEVDRPLSVKELSEQAEIDQRSLSKTLLELRERGWVAEVDTLLTRMLDRRRSYYELAEPLVRLAFQIKAARDRPIALLVDFLKHWYDPDELAGTGAVDLIAAPYLQAATEGQWSDTTVALARHIQGLPRYREPAVEQLAELDVALGELAAGDPIRLLALPSALRAAVEGRLHERVGKPPGGITRIRLGLHHAAAKEFGLASGRKPEGWLVRARTLLVDDHHRPNALAILVGWLLRLGHLDEASAVVDELVQSVSADHQSTILARIELAFAYAWAGRLAEAIALQERTVADQERVLGPDHPDTLTSRSNLGSAYAWAGRLAEAITLQERTLADQERVLGPDHPDTFPSRSNLAIAYARAGRLAEAITLQERNLADRERVWGLDHPYTLTSRSNLASAYASAGRLAEAITLHERTLADRERALGPDHPDTLSSWSILASAYASAGRLGEAITLHERTLADRERVLGPDHPDTFISQNNLASSYALAGRLGEAITLYERTLADAERVLGLDHPHTRQVRKNLAAAQRQTPSSA